MWQGLKIWGSRGSSAYRACARLAWSSVTSPPRRNPDFQRARLGARKPRGLATSRNSFTGGLRDPSRMAPGSRTPRKTRTQRASRSASRPVLTEAHAACPLPTGAYIPLAAARTQGTSFRIPPGPAADQQDTTLVQRAYSPPGRPSFSRTDRRNRRGFSGSPGTRS